MATDRLKLYNAALSLCGATTLHPTTGLSQNCEDRRQLDAAWDNDAVRTCLEAGLWNFAMRTVELSYSVDIEPPFGYRRVFEKPDDLIRVAGVYSDEGCTEPLLDYRDEADYFFGHVETMYVRYVSDDNEYGMDFAKWPYSFSRFVEAYLADKVVLKVTAGDEKRILKVERALKKSKADALAKDAQREATQFPPEGGWVRARRGQGSRNRDPSGGQLTG